MTRALMLAFAIAAVACGDEHGHHDDEVPEEYEGMTNPFDGDMAAATAGAPLYGMNCAGCHGANGRGDGPNSGGLDPAPTDFHEHTLGHEDDYVFWRISEGGLGEPVTSAMPAWKSALTEDEIWQVITFMRFMDE